MIIFIITITIIVIVTEVTRISVQPLYFRNHTPTVLYNQKYKEYEITKNVEISTKNNKYIKENGKAYKWRMTKIYLNGFLT